MKKTNVLAWLLGLGTTVAGCDNLAALNRPSYKEEKIPNIIKVIMQDPKKYTLLIKKDSVNIQLRTISMRSIKTYLRTDVSVDEPMLWAQYYTDNNDDDSLIIHLHSAQEILTLKQPEDILREKTEQMILK